MTRTTLLQPAVLLAALAATVALGAGCRTSLRPLPDTQAFDLDGDGRLDRLQLLDESGEVVRTTSAPAPGSDPAKTLILAIDAIPYDLFARLQDEGLFREFFPATRLVAPFPSLTDVGFTAILKTRESMSYEDRYYDRDKNEMGGGTWARITNKYKELAPFHELWDWEEPHLWGAFVFFAPGRISGAELRRVEQQLYENPDDELILYLGSTDALGHVQGVDGLERHLRKVYRVLRGYLANGGAERRVVLFSDHGMSRVPSEQFDLAGVLAQAGFRLRDRRDSFLDVVTPAYGLIGSIQLYTECGQEEAVARAVVRGDGADFAAWRDGDRLRMVTADGAIADDLFDRPHADYPYLRERLRDGLFDHVRKPASVIVSLADGWHYGSGLFDSIVSLVGTHGSARYTSSVGFLASNTDRTPAWLRAEDAYPYLGLDREPVEPEPFVDPCRDDSRM